MSEIAGQTGLRAGATAVVNESYSFACMRCGHGWEQSYEIEHHTDAAGHEFVLYVADGRGRALPAEQPDLPELRRSRRADHAARAGRVRAQRGAPAPPRAAARRAGGGTDGGRRGRGAGSGRAERERAPPLASVRPAAPLPAQGELTVRLPCRRPVPLRGGRAPFVGSGHAFERLRPAGQERGPAPPGAPPGAGRRLPHPPGHAVRHGRGGAGEGGVGRSDDGRAGRLRPQGLAVGGRDGGARTTPSTRPSPCTRTRRRASCTATPTAGRGRARASPAGRRRWTTRSPRSTGWPRCRRSRASVRRASTTSAPGPRARRRRSGPSAPTSRSPSGTARPWSSTTARPTPTSCAS